MSVFNQLDTVDAELITPMGRVRPPKADDDVIHVVGADEAGTLVRSRSKTAAAMRERIEREATTRAYDVLTELVNRHYRPTAYSSPFRAIPSRTLDWNVKDATDRLRSWRGYATDDQKAAIDQVISTLHEVFLRARDDDRTNGLDDESDDIALAEAWAELPLIVLAGLR
jgi:phytoene dehydrogenase-like protein